MAQGPEFLTVQRHIADINSRIQSADLPTFSSELLQAGLITDATHRSAIAVTGLAADREIASLTAVAMAAIKATPSLFNSLVDILETRDKEIASTLRYECCESVLPRPIKFIVSRRRGGEEQAGGIDHYSFIISVQHTKFNNEIMKWKSVSCGMMRAGNGKQ